LSATPASAGKLTKRKVMKKPILIVIILLLGVFAIFVYAKISARAENFKPAEDFPRAALIYVQIRDLPALIKLWNDSELRRKYLDSANFNEFQNNHLALKLAERADEIDFELGIFPDLGFASSLSENNAAAAVYDIGRLEFVFIAPLSEEKFLASRLFQLQAGFEALQLDDETTVYTKEIEVDRARQSQKILFANFRGRLILATSEKYFLQTLDNIKGKTPQNRLAGDPLFKQLAEKTTPHLATVWLNQQKLNDDWYFNHYWLMTGNDQLKNLRAGTLDFEIADKKAIERRTFLTAETEFSPAIKTAAARRVAGLIPANVQFYKIEAAEKTAAGELLSNVLFDAAEPPETIQTAEKRKDYYFRDWEKSFSYSYLDDDFSEQVDETGDDEILPENTGRKSAGVLSRLIGAANPEVSVKLFSPRNLPSPLFFETRKALIFSMQNPGNLKPAALETALSETAQNLFTVNNQKADFAWTDFSIGEFSARQLAMPSLGWKIFYARRNAELIFANSEDFLREILTAGENAPQFAETFEKLTVLRLANGRDCFADVFRALEQDEKNSGDADNESFFVGNIGSLLKVFSDVERIEIKQTSAPNFLFEEIDFVFKNPD
jgi:hypothetical protein